MDDRGVSAVLGYILTLGIMALLIGGLFLAAGNFVENQQERAIRAELEVVGNRLAADIAAVDRLALATGSAGEARLESQLPDSTAGQGYQINVSPVSGAGDVHWLNLTTTDPDVAVEVKVRVETAMVESTVNGGDVIVAFNGTHVEVRDA